MQTQSHVISILDQGMVLDVALGEFNVTAYVVISEPDLDRVAEFVPRENYEQHASVHVAAVADQQDAREQVGDLTLNLMPGDAAVFLCRDEGAYVAALYELGQSHTATQPN